MLLVPFRVQSVLGLSLCFVPSFPCIVKTADNQIHGCWKYILTSLLSKENIGKLGTMSKRHKIKLEGGAMGSSDQAGRSEKIESLIHGVRQSLRGTTEDLVAGIFTMAEWWPDNTLVANLLCYYLNS